MSETVKLRGYDAIQEAIGNIGWYQLRVLLASQLGYLAVTGSMLCTIFDTMKPASLNCTNLTGNEDGSSWAGERLEFHSLLLDLGLLCSNAYVPTLFSTMVMGGGVIGACTWGYAADRWGRKWTMMVPLCGVTVCNAILAAAGSLHLGLTAVLLLGLGWSGGGFMVTNIVFAVEAFGGQQWRLGAVSFNGWPAGLMLMSLLGYLTAYWRYYHMALAFVALPVIVLTTFFTYESPRWLIQHQRLDEALEILQRVARINGSTHHVSMKEVEDAAAASEKEGQAHKQYSYLDLVRYSSILIPLLALFYSWLASSIISFGIYFSLGSLSGNIFLNQALLGLLKGATGMIPFLVCRWVGRKTILLVAATVACLSSWAAVLIYFLHPAPKGSPWLTVFAVLGAAAIDPIWKVNHLYSTELFPTVVRNMARAVCNVGSRLGSVIGPQTQYLGTLFGPSPFLIFGILSIFHVIISAIVLPETRGQPLPDRLPDKKRDRVGPVQMSDLRAREPDE